MTRSDRTPTLPRPALALVVVLLAAQAVAGCSLRALRLRGDAGAPAAASAPPPRPAADTPAGARTFAALEPTEPYWPYRVALALEAADSSAAAERELRASLARDARYAPALASLSKRLHATGRHAEAVRMLGPVLADGGALEPVARRVLLVGLALHLEALGRHQEAARALADAGALEGPERAAAVLVALRGPSPETAAPLAQAALEADPRRAVNLNNHGIARLRAGAPDEARRAFLAAIARDPALPGPYYNLAILERWWNQDEAAGRRWFAEYRRRSSADPDSLWTVFGRAEPVPLAEGGAE